MPRYFFHIRENGTLIEDEEGSLLASPEEAHLEALKAAREILAEKLLAGQVVDGGRFEIADEDGQTIDTVLFRSAMRTE